ncbi:MAG: hypothetical protein MUF42_08225 [Cytophagaceae bacterium]|jgi:hypothetical protein|nr:hypothetical protein [Cytophagaceae bacterium]
MIKRTFLLFLCLTTLPCFPDCIKLSDSSEFIELTKYLEVFEDISNKVDIAQIDKQTFVPHSGNGFPFVKDVDNTYWVRFCLQSNASSSIRWMLENADPHIDEFDLYQTTPAGIKLIQAGYSRPFGIRAYQHKNFVFDLHVGPTPQWFYAKIKSSHHNPFIFKLTSNNYLIWYALNEYYLLGIFYGILIIMAIYNLIIYFSLKENLYLFYVVYVACCALLTLSEDGLGFQYLWPDSPGLNSVLAGIAPLLLVLSFTFYSKVFLELKTNLPKLDQLLTWMMIVYVPFFFLDLTVFKISKDFPIYIIPFSILYIAAILCWKSGFRQARYFLLGYSFMFISIILLLLRMTGLYHLNTILSVYSFNIGMVFEVVMLSFALSDRLRIIRAEREQAKEKIIQQLQENERLKDKVNRELEEKVKERTKEIAEKNSLLENANEKLKDQAEEIQRMNLLLDADNRKLQNNVKDLVKARVMQEEVDFEEFRKIFPTEDSCYRYLAELKWEKGYTCRKCGHLRFCDGKEKYSKRCTRCRYDESPTAYTIFHRLKFDVLKAFYMVFLVYANKGKITSLELSQMLKLRQSTCWTFSKKVTKAMKERKKTISTDGHGWSYLIMDPEEEDEN